MIHVIKKVMVYMVCISGCLILTAHASSSVQQREADKILQKFMKIEKHKPELFVRKKVLEDNITLTAWYAKNKLQVLSVKREDEMALNEDHYYFDENSLMLCRSISTHFSIMPDGKLSKEKKTETHYLLYKQGDLIQPNANLEIQQTYLALGKEKRNELIELLALAFTKQV